MVPRSLHAAPLVVRSRYMIVAPRPVPRCAPLALGCGAQADARGAAQVLDRGAHVTARGAARLASKVLSRGAQAVARGGACCASQVLGHGAQAVVRGASRFICRVARLPSRQCTFGEFKSLAVASRLRWREHA